MLKFLIPYDTRIFLTFTFLLIGHVSWAQNVDENLDFQGSLGVGFSQLGNSKANLKDRTMEAFSVDSFLGYKTQYANFGLHLDYRMQEQVTSLSNAGGTNLKGRGLFFDLGAKVDLSDKLYTMCALDFFGRYDLEKDTAANEDDELRSPMVFHLRGGGRIFENHPQFSIDLDLMYASFQKLHINGTNLSWTSQQYGAAVLLTYHFGQKFTGALSPDAKTRIENNEGQ